MVDDHPGQLTLHEFDAGARHVVREAGAEALALGHDRIGTEHLLLAILADEAGVAVRILGRAGARLPVARSKVLEARPAAGVAAGGPEGLRELTDRAARAVGRAARFARAGQAESATTEHLLMGVLDVEGTAGQVLRGMGVDVAGVRAALEGDDAVDDDPAQGEDRRAAEVSLVCPRCGASIGDDLVFRSVSARGEDGRRDVGVVACGACGAVLGVV